MVSLSIDLDREAKIFFSGEELTGQAVISRFDRFDSFDPREIKKFSVQILGETKTGFFYSKNFFKSHEIHLKIDQNLTEALQYFLAENETLPSETYKVPFK